MECLVCKCVGAIEGLNPSTEQSFAEGLVMGIIAQRALPTIGMNITAFLCPTHLDYCRKAAEIGAKAHPAIAPFCNFGLTVVK
jgi:hypothetical protein